MHLLATAPGLATDGTEAVDLGQTPADIVVLTAADTEIACLAAAQAARHAVGPTPGLRLANLLQLGHNMSVDLYVDRVVRHARLVIVRLLGGRGYWPYGVDEVAAACRDAAIPIAFLPGDDQPDAELAALATVPAEAAHRLWQYLVHGGVDNAAAFLAYAASLTAGAAHDTDAWHEPAPLLRAGLYWPGQARPMLADVATHWSTDAPVAALVFYRALVQAADTAVVDALIEALGGAGLNALPVYAASLRDPVAAETIRGLFAETPPDIILNATAFALSRPGAAVAETPFDATEAPVLQVVFAATNEDIWRAGTNGLTARDIAMNVALPEVDGRILARAVSFKGLARRDEATQADIVCYRPVADRVRFTTALAANWCRLRRTPAAGRRVAIVLANYPNRDGRIGNGVGLDTPASTLNVLAALVAAGYTLADVPDDGAALISALLAGPTNAGVTGREVRETLPRAVYAAWFAALPTAVRDRVTDRWGPPTGDPFFLAERDAFAIPALRCGNVVIGLQPARGYNIDPVRSYHDPALVPPHGYLAFYAWLRAVLDVHAVVHMGKHGNLEWLPGKAVALSGACFPEAAFGPLPHLYPFIVNDPGEGSQAKRRSQAVIIDHLTPPLTRAEAYGPLRALEGLVDEYYEAANLDPRRLPVLRRRILEAAEAAGLDRDLGMTRDEDPAAALTRLDAYLCELKEMQIRDGLHVFGSAPQGELLTDLLVALTRTPRHGARQPPLPGDASLTRALAADLGLATGEDPFDPLDCAMAAPWSGPRPPALAAIAADPWRTAGDTVERLEALAAALVGEHRAADPAWTHTGAVLDRIAATIRPAVAGCGTAEIAGLLRGLDGRFVPPGPSGAPTRGRADVLPTGRNFYSVDTRTVPTAAAWELGWKSARLLVERYAQEHGHWPRAMALSAWGTSNMRTGGDDIAQALALIGARPLWDAASHRVTGFEVLPLAELGRPRVDVTLRVSGFFRDAFPNLIALFDGAVRAIAARADEPPAENPLAAQVVAESTADGAEAALWRVFGAQPGAYGAGLQALIDERGWQSDADLARAYIHWGGYAYGAKADGRPAHAAFTRRLARTQAVIHNQDNREHDLLDSDDYYQFEGGLAAATRHASGRQPAVYHNDHSRPFAPQVRRLEDEVSRVIRARVVNPKWLAGVMRHGYKGAFELAATVDYLFAFAATARCVRDDQFDMVYAAYVEDDAVREFMATHNPDALAEMAARFREALDRGLWRPRTNSAHRRLDALAGTGETP